MLGCLSRQGTYYLEQLICVNNCRCMCPVSSRGVLASVRPLLLSDSAPGHSGSQRTLAPSTGKGRI